MHGRAFIIAMSSVWLSGCGNIHFDLSQSISERTVQGSPIPTSPILGPAFFSPMDLNLDISSEANARNMGAVDRVNLSSITLTITDSALSDTWDEDYFDFLDLLKLYIEGCDGSDLPRVLLAWQDPVPDQATVLNLQVDDTVNLLPYFEQGHQIISETAGFPPSDDISYEGELVVTIYPF